MDRRQFFKTTTASLFALGAVSQADRVLADQIAERLQTDWANPVRHAESVDPALHVLNRITWGARSEDRAKIAEMGIESYIDWQLNADAIPDPTVEQVLADYPVLNDPFAEVALQAEEDYGAVYTAKQWDRIARAVYSERQLYEVLVEFWTDHFNVPIGDLLTQKFIEDRDLIRPNALGSFRELLLASASSPAMMRYLNQASSDKEFPNENYAREVMELHTLGVTGGYTEADVKALARILTGWTVNEYANRMKFDSDMHDSDEKVLLGRTFPAGRGVEEGLEALDLLASHPATARYISSKLCRKFIQDQPPASIVDSTAQVFTDTEGSIRAVVKHILMSAEFAASEGMKFRRPFEFYVAVLRALRPALKWTFNENMLWVTELLGQMPYRWEPPNGYPDVAGAWISASLLLIRWNFALTFPVANEGWYGDEVRIDWSKLSDGRPMSTLRHILDRAAELIVPGKLTEAHYAAIQDAIAYDGLGFDDPIPEDQFEARLTMVIGLLFASPGFQWK